MNTLVSLLASHQVPLPLFIFSSFFLLIRLDNFNCAFFTFTDCFFFLLKICYWIPVVNFSQPHCTFQLQNFYLVHFYIFSLYWYSVFCWNMLFFDHIGLLIQSPLYSNSNISFLMESFFLSIFFSVSKTYLFFCMPHKIFWSWDILNII